LWNTSLNLVSFTYDEIIKIVDQGGNEVASYSYDPWGNVLTQTEQSSIQGQPLGYASYVYDTDTNLYYLKARYYNPTIGRFTTKDRFTGSEDRPNSQNQYTYCENDPLNCVDPTSVL
jgi:RHS repeat-associated protein